MKVELEGIFQQRSFPGSADNYKVEYTGIGRRNVKTFFRTWDFWPQAKSILSVGFAGSVDPNLKPGDLCLVERVKSSKENRLDIDVSRSLINRIQERVEANFKICNLLTLNNTAGTSNQKSSLESFPAEIIDRESYWVAEEAKKKHVPFAAVRVVFDGINQNLPPPVCYDNNSGKIQLGHFLSWLLANPSWLFVLPSMVRQTVNARNKLLSVIDQIPSAFKG